MTEADYGPSFQIIAAAGDSKGYSISAIKAMYFFINLYQMF